MNKIGIPDRKQTISRPSSPVPIPAKKAAVKFVEAPAPAAPAIPQVPLTKPGAAPPVPRERRGSFGGLQTLTKSLTFQGDEIHRLEEVVKQQAAVVARYEQSIKTAEAQIKESLTLIQRQEAHILKLEETLDDVING
jgi:hypothetical protein